MKNAFNPEEETERDWDTELAEDVKGECEEKYGKVVDIYVNKESVVRFFSLVPPRHPRADISLHKQGEIYIRFEAVDSASKAVAGLNGRWFGGRQIEALMVSDSAFDVSRA